MADLHKRAVSTRNRRNPPGLHFMQVEGFGLRFPGDHGNALNRTNPVIMGRTWGKHDSAPAPSGCWGTDATHRDYKDPRPT